MGVYIDIEKNVLLRNLRDNAFAQGRAEARAEGRAESDVEGETEEASVILRRLLELKFIPLPKWAENRIHESTPAQIAKWMEEILKVGSLEEILGKR